MGRYNSAAVFYKAEGQTTFIMNERLLGEDSDSELVGHTTHQRNWRGIAIALVVIIVVCSLIITTIILLSPDKNDEVTKQKFTFEDYIFKKKSPHYFSFTWMKDGAGYYFRNDVGAVVRYNCSTNVSIILMDNSTFKELDTSSFTISYDEKYATLPYEIVWVFRHTKEAKYKIVNLTTREAENLVGPDGMVLQYVGWSPAGNGLVFVQGNDIFYRPDLTTTDVTRVTDTGVKGVIFNGIPDWVYEEEIIGNDNAIWWSPDGHYFLFGVFNDTEVQKYDLTYYGSPSNAYVENKRLSYPKAGTTNPTFSLKIYNTQDNTTVDIQPPDMFNNKDHYFTSVSWIDDTRVLITWLNRPQNFTIFTICNADDGTCSENLRQQAETGWLETIATPKSSQSGSHYFTIFPASEGDAGYFRHIAMVDTTGEVDLQNGVYGKKEMITTGLFDVESILAVDDTEKHIYFLAHLPEDPTSLHLYRTTTDPGSATFKQPKCLSCSISEDCKWVSASFSADRNYFMLVCQGPGVPTYHLWSTDMETVIPVEENEKAKEDLAKLSLPRTKYLQIPLEDSSTMWAKLLLPDTLKEDEHIEYNLLMNVYGGPSSQKVTNQFSLSWEHYLSSSHNIVIGYADARGSGGRGDKWRHANYRRLGTTEVEDTIEAARYMKKLSYIGSKTAIWGWSYGGFLTASVLSRGTDVFKCGMAVAPVTDWRYYDTVYTERYMGQPIATDNQDAYEVCNISRSAANFKNSRFMVVHGTGDDNVHFQNTAQLVRALTEANVYFRSQFYTDLQHSINQGNSRRHLYNSLEDFLLQCYGHPAHLDELNKDTPEKDTTTDEE